MKTHIWRPKIVGTAVSENFLLIIYIFSCREMRTLAAVIVDL